MEQCLSVNLQRKADMNSDLFRFAGSIVILFVIAICTGMFVAETSLAQVADQSVFLPVQYNEDRFYVQPVTVDGAVLNFFTDTGGGLFIYKKAVERLGLKATKIDEEVGEDLYVVDLPAFKPGAAIPAPQSGQLPVYSPGAKEPDFGFDGMLGQEWFAGRVWTFDYPRKRLSYSMPAGDIQNKNDTEHSVGLGFKTDESGRRVLNFPRISVNIDGENLEMLFDTGATIVFSGQALMILNDGRPAERATSFITATIFEKWRKAHPNWRVMEGADQNTGDPMIEVPRITIAGYTVGPVLFTRRADKNFHEFMSGFMDQRVEGAIGGNALRHFRITVDYPNAIAIFER
jgi:hypothetical protein